MPLQDGRFSDEDVDTVIEAARKLGVQRLAIKSSSVGDWDRVAALTARHPATLSPSYGVHPWAVADQASDWAELLERRLQREPKAGVGECGLDKTRRALEAVSLDRQVAAFRTQLRLAQKLGRPVSIHCVRAHGRLLDILKEEQPTVPLIMHAWSGSAEMVAALGAAFPRTALFSLSGHILAQAPAKAAATMRAVPLRCLLLETDAPDGQLRLTDSWRQSRVMETAQLLDDALLRRLEPRNSPEVLPQLLRIVAAARGQSSADVAEATWQNACSAFGVVS